MKKLLSFILSSIILAVTIFGLSGTKEYDEALLLAEQITSNFFSSDIDEFDGKVYSYNLQGVDGAEDFILVTRGAEKGYAIFTKEDLQLIEYSAETYSPYEDLSISQSYYAGPVNHFSKKDGKIVNIHTKEVLTKSNAEKLAQNVKSTINKQKNSIAQLENIGEVTVEKPSVEVATAGPTGWGWIDPDKYSVVSRDYIDYYEYFLHNPEHGINTTGTCVTVATQLLLSFNNWAKDGRLITNSNFLLDRTEEDMLKPYSAVMLGTSSENENNGKISFYEQLLEYIDPDEAFATMGQSYNGIKEYLDNYVDNSVNDAIELSYGYLNSVSVIEEEIDNNRAVLAAINYFDPEKIEKVAHAVVVYGKQTFLVNGAEVDGFIAHFGWGKNELNCWFNADWTLGFVTMEINHQHSDDVVNGNAHLYKCSICNRITSSNIHNFSLKKQIPSVNNSDETEYLNIEKKKLTTHLEICNCGYTRENYHNLYEVSIGEGGHYKKCSCGYIIDDIQPHFYAGNVCKLCYHVKEY